MVKSKKFNFHQNFDMYMKIHSFSVNQVKELSKYSKHGSNEPRCKNSENRDIKASTKTRRIQNNFMKNSRNILKF